MNEKINFKSDRPARQWFSRQIKSRKLLSSSEQKISYLQITGFILILIGVSSFLRLMLIADGTEGARAAVSFFLAMLGIAFVFPSMLEDQTGDVSTMRIVTFMMINVLCLILIKIGWTAKSLADINLNQYWVGVIAFVFGAKATQSFFESRMAENTAQSTSTSPVSSSGSMLSADGIVDQGIAKYRNQLKSNPKITGICKSYDTSTGSPQPFMLITTNEEITAAMLSQDGFKVNDGKKDVEVPNKIVNSGRSIVPHGKATPGTMIKSNQSTIQGTLGCVLKPTVPPANNPNQKFGLTCYHVVKNPQPFDQDYIISTDKVIVSDKTGEIGVVAWAICMDSKDYALISLNDASSDNTSVASPVVQPRNFTDNDLKNQCRIKFKGLDASEFIGGYLIGIADDERTIEYPNNVVKKFVGLYMFSGNAQNHVPIAKAGDSGALIMDLDRNPIALLIGSDNSFTYGLPLKPITDENNLILA